VDEDKIQEEARYDGKWVLTTNTDLPAREVALKYKQLWMVEDVFRSMKSLLDTRPIYHKRDETIRGTCFARSWRYYYAKIWKTVLRASSGSWNGPTSSAIWTT
jgi:transposase